MAATSPLSRHRYSFGSTPATNSRTNPPRRKVSGSRFNSEFALGSVPNQANGPAAVSRSSLNNAFPMSQMVDRVSREVERFAETLDRFSAKLRADDQHVKREGALELIRGYKNIAKDAHSKLRAQHADSCKTHFAQGWSSSFKLLSGNSVNDVTIEDPAEAEESLRHIQQWKDEMDTWGLLEILVDEPKDDAIAYRDTEHSRFAGDGQTWEDFQKGNPIWCQKALVLQWLENTTEVTGSDIDIVEEQLEKSAGIGGRLWSQGWMETRERIKGQKRLQLASKPLDGSRTDIRSSTGNNVLIPQLDEDAATRLQKTIEPADARAEQAIWVMLWEMIRRGKPMDEILQWCEDNHEAAKAFAIGAHITTTAGPESIEARLRWRRACRQAARHGGCNGHEKAVFGLLSGDSSLLERFCLSWKDHLYANYNSSLLDAYETFSRDILAGTGVDKDEMSLSRSLDESRGPLDRLRNKAHTAFEKIQANLVSATLVRFIIDQGIALSRRASESHGAKFEHLVTRHIAKNLEQEPVVDVVADDPHVLRFLAHAVIVLKHLDVDFGRKSFEVAAENLIVGYMDFLMLGGKLELLPLYASTMPRSNSNPTLARSLFHVRSETMREQYMALMPGLGLNDLDVLRWHFKYALYEYILLKMSGESFDRFSILEATEEKHWPGVRIKAFNPSQLSVDNERVLQALQWFMLFKGDPCWTQSFYVLTRAARAFLVHGEVACAIELMERMKPSQVSEIKTRTLFGDAVDIAELGGLAEDTNESDLPPLEPDRQDIGLALMPLRLTSHEFARRCDSLRHSSRVYYELGQLMDAIKALYVWRDIEAEVEHANPDESIDLRSRLSEGVEELERSVMPLLNKSFLCKATSVPNDVKTDMHTEDSSKKMGDDLGAIREKYLPEVIIAYVVALFNASKLGVRDRMLDALELANSIVRNEELARCFSAGQRTRELMRLMALCSTELLRQNEREGKRGSAGKSFRSSARNKKIFEIRA